MNPGLKASTIYTDARAVLNDTAGMLFTNPALQPYLQIAMNELAEVFEDNGIPATLKVTSTPIQIPTGVLDIGGATGPALPADLVEINEIWERSSGTIQDFIKMRKEDYLPETPIQTTFLIFWSWNQQQINFIGATSAIEVKLEYVANVFPVITSDDTIIPIINARNPLMFRTAALAAEFIGENSTRAQSLNGQAGAALDRLMNLSISHQQSIVTRRRPFRGGWKTRSQMF